MENAELDKHIQTLKQCKYISDPNADKYYVPKQKNY